jgi:hypothetical protein
MPEGARVRTARLVNAPIKYVCPLFLRQLLSNDNALIFTAITPFQFLLQSYLAAKPCAACPPITRLLWKSRHDLAPHTNRDTVSECVHALQATLVAF